MAKKIYVIVSNYFNYSYIFWNSGSIGWTYKLKDATKFTQEEINEYNTKYSYIYMHINQLTMIDILLL